MGFLTLDTDIAHLKRAVMSIWFRVSSDARDAARAIAVEDPLSRVLHGVIPLVTWGAQQIGHTASIVSVWTGAVQPGGAPIMTQTLGGGPDYFMNPSYIGIHVGSDLNPQDPPVLELFIQAKDFATGSNMFFLITGWAGTATGANYHHPGSPFDGAPIYINVVFNQTDITTERMALAPDFFHNIGTAGVVFDQWHHLLISWDLDGRRMWWALDNADQGGGNDFNSNWEGFAEPDLGEIATLVVTTLPTKPVSVPAHGSVSYTTPEGDSSSKTGAQHVELAELQIFSDVTLDTAIESNRRAFIDYKRDEDGNIIPEADGTNKLKPVDPKKAEDLLGKRPDILLHGSPKWIDGNNTGTLGMDESGNKIDSGQFTPTGNIKQYSPDPSITAP